MRKMLLIKLGGKLADEARSDMLPEFQSRLMELSQQLTHNRLQTILERWLEVENSWRSSEIWQLPLELAIVDITTTNTNGALLEGDQPKPETQVKLDKTANHNPEVAVGDTTLEIIIERWPEVVAGLREYNHSLSFILSVARPIKLEGNTLTVAFSYQLHLERVKEPKLVAVIEQAMSTVFNAKLKLQSRADEAPAGGDLLSNVLTTFGGRVVE